MAQCITGSGLSLRVVLGFLVFFVLQCYIDADSASWKKGRGDFPAECHHVHSNFLLKIRDWNFLPHTILDVGANRGIWSCQAYKIFEETKPAMFAVEASTDYVPFLDKLPLEYFITLVGSKEGMVNFYELKNSTGNSIFVENNKVFESVGAKQKLMRTLDGIIASKGTALQKPIIFKLDVQGAEIEVLRGANRVLKDTELLILETSVLEYNKGAPLATEVIAYLHSVGFELLDIVEAERKRGPGVRRGVLNQVDFAFVQQNSTLFRTANEIGLHGKNVVPRGGAQSGSFLSYFGL